MTIQSRSRVIPGLRERNPLAAALGLASVAVVAAVVAAVIPAVPENGVFTFPGVRPERSGGGWLGPLLLNRGSARWIEVTIPCTIGGGKSETLLVLQTAVS